MRTVHRLQVDLRVPITVVEDNCVRCHQVQAEAACSRRNQENLLGRARLHELLDLLLTLLQTCVAIQSTVVITTNVAEVFQDVKHRSEAAKNERLVSICDFPLEELVDKDHLACSRDQVLARLVGVLRLDILEKVRVIAHFSQLDQNVLVVRH